MKLHPLTLLALLTSAVLALSSCGGAGDGGGHADHDPGHDGEHPHDHDGEDHDHDGEDHDHDGEDHDHAAHAPAQAGPNGGRVLTEVEPHAEFFVRDDRRVQVTFLDDALEPVPLGGQVVSVIAGDRSAPTRLAFAREAETLVSDGALPGGNDFPVVVQVASAAGADPVLSKFNLNLEDCPTCEFKEYACACEH